MAGTARGAVRPPQPGVPAKSKLDFEQMKRNASKKVEAKRMKKLIWSNVVMAAAIACLSGCGKKPETASLQKSTASYPLPDPPLVATCQPGKPGGRLVASSFADPKTFNPITANESSSWDVYRLMFASLLGYDMTSQEVEPGLAGSWTNSPDGKTWTFRLRKNLRWSDGAPLTADDVVFTWNDVIYNPKIDNVTRDLFIVNGKEFTVTKVDDLTIKVVTPVVYAPFLEFFGTGVQHSTQAHPGQVRGRRDVSLGLRC